MFWHQLLVRCQQKKQLQRGEVQAARGRGLAIEVHLLSWLTVRDAGLHIFNAYRSRTSVGSTYLQYIIVLLIYLIKQLLFFNSTGPYTNSA